MIGTRKTTRSAESAAESANETFVGGTQSQEAEEPLDERRKELAKTLLDLMLRNASAPDGSFLPTARALAAGRRRACRRHHADASPRRRRDDQGRHHQRPSRTSTCTTSRPSPRAAAHQGDPAAARTRAATTRTRRLPSTCCRSLSLLRRASQALRSAMRCARSRPPSSCCACARPPSRRTGASSTPSTPSSAARSTCSTGACCSTASKPLPVARDRVPRALPHDRLAARADQRLLHAARARCASKVLARLKQLLWMERALDQVPRVHADLQAALPHSLGAGKGGRPPTRKSADRRGPGQGGRASRSKALAASKGKGKGKAVAPPKAKARKAREDVCSDSSDDDDEPMTRRAAARDGRLRRWHLRGGAAPRPPPPRRWHQRRRLLQAQGQGRAQSAAGCAAIDELARSSASLPTRVSPSTSARCSPSCRLRRSNPRARGSSYSRRSDRRPRSTSSSSLRIRSSRAGCNPPLQALASAAAAPAVAAAPAAAPPGSDLASMELRRLSPCELLQRLLPTLLTYPEHLRLLKSICPQRLRDGDVIDHAAAFGAEGADEHDALEARFVEPALLGAIQSLRTLLESKQLHDDDSQRALLAILARFDADGAMGAADESAGSQAPAGSPAGVALGSRRGLVRGRFRLFRRHVRRPSVDLASVGGSRVVSCDRGVAPESGFKIRGPW